MWHTEEVDQVTRIQESLMKSVAPKRIAMSLPELVWDPPCPMEE